MNKNHKLSPSLKETSDFKTNKEAQAILEKEKLNIIIKQIKEKQTREMLRQFRIAAKNKK